MLNRTHRFHGYNSLRGIYRSGQTVRSPLISLKYTARQGNRPYRAAVVVSRKVHKSAVVRNRIRRRVYEQIRLEAPKFIGPYDLVFTAFSEQIATMPAADLQATIHQLFAKAGLLAA